LCGLQRPGFPARPPGRLLVCLSSRTQPTEPLKRVTTNDSAPVLVVTIVIVHPWSSREDRVGKTGPCEGRLRSVPHYSAGAERVTCLGGIGGLRRQARMLPVPWRTSKKHITGAVASKSTMDASVPNCGLFPKLVNDYRTCVLVCQPEKWESPGILRSGTGERRPTESAAVHVLPEGARGCTLVSACSKLLSETIGGENDCHPPL
jgi:hypothetical protein